MTNLPPHKYGGTMSDTITELRQQISDLEAINARVCAERDAVRRENERLSARLGSIERAAQRSMVTTRRAIAPDWNAT